MPIVVKKATKKVAKKAVKPKEAVQKETEAKVENKPVSDKTAPYFLVVFRYEGNPLYKSCLLGKKMINFDPNQPKPLVTEEKWYSIDKFTGELKEVE